MSDLPFPETIELHDEVALVAGPARSLVVDERPGGVGEPRLIHARTDLEAVQSWLNLHRYPQSTFESYRREAERLLIWCAHVQRRTLAELRVEDLIAFEQFLAAPPRSPRWIINWTPGGPGPSDGVEQGDSTKRVRRPARNDPHWAPFAGPLGPGSVRKAMSVIRALFTYLYGARYLLANPFAIKPKPRARKPAAVSRFLPPGHWAEVQTTIREMPTHTKRAAATAARARWLFSLLYVGGMRVSEVCSGTMGNFHDQVGADGVRRCWLYVVGKGDKERRVPVTTDLLEELARYRATLGLKGWPHAGEQTPLVSPAIGEGGAVSRQSIHNIVKQVVKRTAERLRLSQDPHMVAAAEHIEQASSHWMRHTAASAQVRALGSVLATRDNLGHSSVSTTSVYTHVEDERRHDETSAGHRLTW